MAEEKMNQNGAAGDACMDTGQPETAAAAGAEAEKAAEDTEMKDAVKDPSGAAEAEDKKETEDSRKDASKEDTAAAKDSGRGFFGKKNSKEKALQEQIDGLNDKVKRQMAEFDNYRKRTEKEKQQQFSLGERDVIEKLLPVVDNFERAFATVEADDEEDAFVKGMRMVYKQLTKQLEDLGVRPIEAQGKPFDPEFHNAVMQAESDELESGTVAQELQKGYMFHDMVIRHSMVSVVK